MTNDYSSAALDYWAQGWRGVLPLPPAAKKPVPEGFTGYKGEYPSYPDIHAWIERHSGGNTALRLPKTIIGIDVDHYGKKRGGETLAYAEQQWGALPGTFRSTSRIDGVSGIRLFQVPIDTELETVLGFPERGLGDVEIIQYFHRYAVVWPSVHAETERTYRWLDPNGDVTTRIPRPADLPPLPSAWLEGLKRGSRTEITASADVRNVLAGLGTEPPSGIVKDRLDQAKTELLDSGSRHDSTLKHVLALLRLSERGEPGVGEALRLLRESFVLAISRDRGSMEDAAAEFDRMVRGQRGHDLIASTPTDEVAKIFDTPASTVAGSTTTAPPAEPEDDLAWFGVEVLDREERADAGLTESATSWGPVDLRPILDGSYEPEMPTRLARNDGVLLWYPGRVNGLAGPPESGKSWLALEGCRQTMLDGGNVVYIDFEDTAQGIVSRFQSLGLSNDIISARLTYIRPEQSFGPLEQEELFQALDSARPAVTVVDGVNASMTQLGWDLSSNTDATKFHQIFLQPLTRNGSAVVLADHIPKNGDANRYAIGAQAKLAMIDGVQLGVRCVKTFGRGTVGELSVTINKDKLGNVRPHSVKGERGVDLIARITVDARNEPVKIDIQPPSEKLENTEKNSLNIIMIRLSKWLEEHPGEHPTMEIIRCNEGRDKDKRAALGQLRELGYVRLAQRGKGNYYALVRPYGGDPDLEIFESHE